MATLNTASSHCFFSLPFFSLSPLTQSSQCLPVVLTYNLTTLPLQIFPGSQSSGERGASTVAVCGCNMTQWTGLGLTQALTVRQAQPSGPKTGCITHSGGVFLWCPYHTLWHCLCAKTRRTYNLTDRAAFTQRFSFSLSGSTRSNRRSCFAVGSHTLDAGGSCPCCCSSPLFLT